MCNCNPEERERELIAGLNEDPAGEEGTLLCAGSFAPLPRDPVNS